MSISRCRSKYIYGLIWNGDEILEDQIGGDIIQYEEHLLEQASI